RLLHTGNPHDHGSLPARRARPFTRAHPRRAGRKPVPVHGLSEHRHRGAPRRGSDEMTARVPYVAADPVFARVEAMGRPVLNLYRALANQPAALDAFLDMSRYVRGDSSLDAELREAVIRATAQELGSECEGAHDSMG